MKKSIESRAKSGWTTRPKPLVGFPGLQNSLSSQRRLDGIYCRVSTGTYAFVVIGTAFFGPCIAVFLYWKRGAVDSHMPGLIFWAIWFLVLLSSVGFVRYALGCPRFKADYSTGQIFYFPWWWSRPSLVLRLAQIQNMEIEERFFREEGIGAPNYYLIVTTNDGNRYALCVSTQKQIIMNLKKELENFSKT